MDFQKLLDLNYLFSPYTYGGFSWTFRIILLVFFAGSLIWAFWAGIKQSKNIGLYKKGWRRWQLWGHFNGWIGFLLLIFRESGAVYLGSRIWMLLWLAGALIWALLIIKYWRFTVPTQAQEIRRKEEFNKWLPKENRHAR